MFMHMFLCKHIFLALLEIYLKVELLGYIENFKSFLKRTICVQLWLSKSYKSEFTTNLAIAVILYSCIKYTSWPTV